MDWDELKKIAETNKYKAEAKKAEAEKRKIDLETQELEKEASKKWWSKLAFRKVLVSVALGLPVIGFYIIYVITPAVNVENMKLKLDNQRAEERIVNAQQQLTLDSQRLARDSQNLVHQIKITDSLNLALQSEIGGKKKLDEVYKKIIQNYETDKVNFSKGFKQLADSAKILDQKYNTSKKLAEELSYKQLNKNLTVIVLVARTTQPISNVSIKITPYGSPGEGTTHFFSGTTLLSIPSGTYFFYITAQGFMPLTQQVQVNPGVGNSLTFSLNPS